MPQIHRYLSMASSFINVNVHFVWATRYRTCTIRPEWRRRLIRYIVSTMQRAGCRILAANVVADHVHVLAVVPAVLPLATVANMAKGASSRFVNSTLDPNGTFQWQDGYSATSVCGSCVLHVKRYIANQQQRHANLDQCFADFHAGEDPLSTLTLQAWDEFGDDSDEGPGTQL